MKHEEGWWRTVDIGVAREVGLISRGPTKGYLCKANPISPFLVGQIELIALTGSVRI
jgi:hypothetical protein